MDGAIVRRILLLNTLRLIFIAFAFLFALSPARAGEAKYFYDGLGRLVGALTDEGEAVRYEYDEVGNLSAILKERVSQLPPVATGVSPQIIFAGKASTVTISGENLFTAQRVDVQGASVRSFSAAAGSITLTLSVPYDTAPGTVSVDIATPYGSTRLSLTLAKITFSPDYIVAQAGGAALVTARVTPALPYDMNVPVFNMSPGMINTPAFITLLASGETAFTVTALKEGMGGLRVEGAEAIIFASERYEGGAFARSAPVSVAVEAVGATLSPPVCVAPATAGTAVSRQVSVQIKN